jgi:YjbE family integral membrane protein
MAAFALAPPLPNLARTGILGMEMLLEGAFWVALSQIMLIDLVLAGDNAVVIALACRNLPVEYRNRAIILGSAGAIILRFIFCIIVAWLLLIPYLKIVGALLLIWIGIKLVAQEEGEGDGAGVAGKVTLFGAIQTIIIADAVMSLDNAIGIAAAATKASGGDEVRAWTLIITGLLITIPIIVFGSQIVLRLMRRFPVIILIGGGLLGFIAGEMLVTDPAIHHWVEDVLRGGMPAGVTGAEDQAAWLKSRVHYAELVVGAVGAVLTLAAGLYVKRRAAAHAHKAVDLARTQKEQDAA